MFLMAEENSALNANPAPQVPAMVTSGASGQNVEADRGRTPLCDERPAGGSNPADAG